MKTYCGSGGIAPCILDLGTKWRWVVSLTPQPLYLQGKSRLCPLDRRQSSLTHTHTHTYADARTLLVFALLIILFYLWSLLWPTVLQLYRWYTRVYPKVTGLSHKEINDNDKHSFRSKIKGYDDKTHYTDSQNSDTTASSGRELYHLQFRLQATSPETFGYTIVESKTAGVSQTVLWLGYWLEDRGSIPGRDRDFFYSPPRPDWLWGPRNLLYVRYQG
jgi:hypothetical protein